MQDPIFLTVEMVFIHGETKQHFALSGFFSITELDDLKSSLQPKPSYDSV